ncbi:MAG: uroporphyrinogen decarboxylase family protein [Victivallales bacterium]
MAGNRLQISLNLMPAFFSKHIGTSYGDRYYFDPAYRAEVERAEGRYLFEILGQFGVGDKEPRPSSNLFIQPIDLVKATQGAEIYCPPDATLETHGHPWAAKSPDEIRRIPAADAARHPVVDTVLKQYAELSLLYGEDADIFGIKSGRMGIHAPFTTAHQLMGEELFFLMVDNPEAAGAVFLKIWEIYRAVYSRLASELRVPSPVRIHMGDCSACMLSEELYRSSVLPVNRKIAGDFQTASYHSCGGSTHLISAFSELPPLTHIELGPGTDLARAVQLMPKTAMSPLVDPVIIRNGKPKEVESLVESLTSETSNAPAVTLCAWSLDMETPVENLQALYGTLEEGIT